MIATLSFRAPAKLFGAALSTLAGLSLAVASPALAQHEDRNLSAEETEEPAKKPSKSAIKGQKRLERMLDGRVAGEPRNCIQSLPTQRFTTINRTAYVFGRGDTIWVQRTRRPDQINDRETLVMRRFGAATQICKQDVATTIDPFTRIFTGAVFFEEFVPYTRVEEDDG